MITKAYKSYEDFLIREDKSLNGVLESDGLTHEKLNEDNGNTGCWRCCSGCSGCSRCSDCSDCSECSDCFRCSGCSGCSGCRIIPAKSKYACFVNVYKYVCSPRILENGEQWIQMGCHLRTRADWERDEWNNPHEFPNDGSPTSRARHFALQMAYQWLDFNAKKNP
jgi:hypothetical protein